MAEKGQRSLECFLKNVLDSSQELSKIQSEVRASEELHQHTDNDEYNQSRHRRGAGTLSGSAAKDPRKLRRVLDLYMKRAQIFRLADPQQKLGSYKGKRALQGTPSSFHLSDNNLPECGNTNNNAQNCKHKQPSSERQKLRIRRWRCKNQKNGAAISEKTEVTNSKDEKHNSVSQNNMDIKNNMVAVDFPLVVPNSPNKFETSNVQSNNPLSNLAQKHSSNVRNIASYKNNDFPAHSQVSKELFSSGNNAHSSVNSPYRVGTETGVRYDMDCVHEVAPLQGSIRRDSSLVDHFSNTRNSMDYSQSLLRTANGINEAQRTKQITFGLGGEGLLNKMRNDQGRATPFSKEEGSQSGLDSDSIGDNLDFVNPIIVDVLSKVSNAVNETGNNNNNNNMDLKGMEDLATINNTRYSEHRAKPLAKPSPIDKVSQEKIISIKDKFNTKVQDLTNNNKVASPNSLSEISHENGLAKSSPSESKNELNELSTSKLQNIPDTSQISTPNKNAQNLEGMAPSNPKGKTNLIQKSESPDLLSVQKAPDSVNKAIHKPAAPHSNLAEKGLAHSAQRKIENTANPGSLHAKNNAASHKSKLDSDIVLRTELLHSPKSDKSSVSQPRTQDKPKSSQANTKPKVKKIKQKRESLETTAQIWHQTEEDSKRKERRAGEIDGIASKEQSVSSSSIDVKKENIKAKADDHWLSSDKHDQKPIGETNQNVDHRSNSRLITADKRSLKTSGEKLYKESFMRTEVKNEQKELNQADRQSRSTDPLRRKRSSIRHRKHVKKGKRQYRQERNNNLGSNSKSAHISPYKNMAKYVDSESREDRIHRNMLRQVDNMIRSLKQENHLTTERLSSGGRFGHRVGRRLQSVTDEVRDNSGGSNDNDDYYYYDEADVDKHKPEHSKVSQKMGIKEISDTTSVRKREDLGEYVQKPFRGIEYLKTVNPTNIRYSNNDDPSSSHIPNERVPSDLITSESNKFSLFNKEEPEEAHESRYGVNSRSSSKKERSNDYGGNDMEKHNPRGSSPKRPEDGNQNTNSIINIPKPAVNERKPLNTLTNKNPKVSRLNEGQLAQVDQLLNEIVLNQTPIIWDEIGQDEIGYNAHLRYKRADNVHKIDASHKNENESMKAKNATDEMLRIEENAEPNSVNATKAVVKETEDKNKGRDAITNLGLYIKDHSGGTAKPKIALHDTSFLKDGSNIKNGKDNVETTNPNLITGVNHGYSAVETPAPISNEQTTFTTNIRDAEVNVSQHNNDTQSKNDITLRHLKNTGSSIDTTSRENYVQDTLPEGEIHLGKNNEPFKRHSIASNDWLGSNSVITSHTEGGIMLKEAKEKSIQQGSSHKEQNDKISEYHKHFTENPLKLNADMQARNSAMHDESHKDSGTNFITSKQTRLLTGYIANFAEVPKENTQTSSDLRDENDLSQESSPVLVRNKRSDKHYIDEALQKHPDDFDYSNENEANDYTYDNASYTGEGMVSYTDLYTVQSPNTSIFSESSVTTLGTTPPAVAATEFNNYTSTSPKPNADVTSKPEKELVNDFQSFNLPRDFNDNSQLNNTINGALANRIVDIVFEAVDASENLKNLLGSALKKSDHWSKEKQPNFETGVSQEMLDKEEEQYHRKTGSLLSKVMQLLDVLVEEEASKRSCIALEPELQHFLLWMLDIPQPEKLSSNDYSIPDNFLFMKRTWRPDQQTKENGIEDLNIDTGELNHQIELLRDLITQYVDLPDNEKAKVKYVMVFLKEQLQALEKIRSSKHNGKNSDKSRTKNPKDIIGRLRDKATRHGLPNEAIKDIKMISFGNPEIYALEHRNSKKNAFKINSGIRYENNWSKGRRQSEQSVISTPDGAKSRFSVDRILTRSRQRKRRYGSHGHGRAKHRYHNVTRLYVPTMEYRKLIKRAAEFRRRRNSDI